MKKLIIAAILFVTALPAMCDGTGTLIEWPGWSVTSNEDIYIGHKHTSFPLTYLLDDNPATSWVFSGTGKHDTSEEAGFALTIARDPDMDPVEADGLWIMNGYNKSPELFKRNNRIIQLKLYVNETYLKTVALADAMGWHKISIPKQPLWNVKLKFTKFAKGKDNDVCVSELALYDGGKKIDLKMPKAVIYTPGSDCGDGQEFYLIDRTGKRLAEDSSEYRCREWSKSGRYIAGVEGSKLWVADAMAGKVIMRKPLGSGSEPYVTQLRWQGEHFVVATIQMGSDEDSAHDAVKTFEVTGQ